MDGQIQQAETDPGAAALERAKRQRTSLATSLGWLLTLVEAHSALLPQPDAGSAARLRRAARTLSWNSPEQERLAFFAERLIALEGEAERALAPGAKDEADSLAALALRLEQASAEALAFYMAMQGEAARAAELSRASEADEESPARLGARAEIGAGVRARLAAAGASKLPTLGLELFRVTGFLSEEECGALIELIERDLYPSGVLGRDIPGFRTSKSCNLTALDPPVDSFEYRVSQLLGINSRFSEVVQGQRYEVGQEFKPHHDFFHRGESYYEDVTQKGGQRTWTAMTFLNRPEAGGNTGFPLAGLDAEPEPGSLLIWNNMQADGRPNRNSLHHGMPVEGGRKYVLTKWFRERPMVFA